ncbi:hypothetical protein CFP65_2525 [Kitasatospora sp. MMS16-BH015]|uniref:hypothetical protein n=1 Tax=Kitasatospora sp. MMS16-BH015 TaxID=2018025 RepID=UPI000CA0C5F2|nr:hypothetical protein [Kitasatospora sp. MMS16-BH015]AUG77354.1 hypothetical protein CFP65_2525 [Kitasatospora sp. MMS16-BH015]
MGILDRLLGRSHQPAADPTERAALAHDEAADAFAPGVERSAPPAAGTAMTEEDRQAAADMTAEGDPWD